MSEYRLTFPIDNDSQIRQLRIGDNVIIDGIVIGIRDASLIRLFDEQQKPPLNLAGSVCLHTAPGVKKIGQRFEKVCIGTTTSTRMDRFTEPLMQRYGVKAIIGKAGLLQSSVQAMKSSSGCYLAITGGAAALETKQIEEIQEVHWEDLMPECIWKFRVKDFGPLIVAIDCYGNNLYFEVKNRAKERLGKIYQMLNIKE